MHPDKGQRLGPASTSCHEGNLDENRPEPCAHCHREANEPDDPVRLGLKGAYHRQCIGCHEKLTRATRAPLDCLGCHRRNTPDHRLMG